MLDAPFAENPHASRFSSRWRLLFSRDHAGRLTPRAKAAWSHLALGVLLAFGLCGVPLFIWYPSPLYPADQRAVLIGELVAGAVLTGPLVTLLIFDRRPRTRRIDFAWITLLQVLVLACAVVLGFQSRPAFVVFHHDRFEVVPADALKSAKVQEAKSPDFRSFGVKGPRLVIAEMPTDIGERNRIAFGANFGEDLVHLPKYYIPYAEAKAETLDKARPIDGLQMVNPRSLATINKFLAKHGHTTDTVRYLPVVTQSVSAVAIIDASTGDFLGMLPLAPGSAQQVSAVPAL